ncbi:MAG: peptidylprolyl isomerase, partial [Clostridia bacterium]|nr:peptidylprolyl isomerase [Clostridia bacterium]
MASNALVVTPTESSNVSDEASSEADSSDESSEVSKDDVSTSLDKSLTYYAIIDVKDYGKITLQLDQNEAPITVENFVLLAEDGFYDGLTFHRIMEDFMMQGGDPKGNSTGGTFQRATTVKSMENNLFFGTKNGVVCSFNFDMR